MDHVNIMAYDYNGSWNNFTGHNAPLWPTPGRDFNVQATAQAWMSAGFLLWITLGLPWYGRTWNGVSCSGGGDPATGLGCAAANAPAPGRTAWSTTRT